MQQIVRPILSQPLITLTVAVGLTPTPIVSQGDKTSLVESFIISVDTSAANSVFLGDQGVTINSGIEIVAGAGPVNFAILNQAQQYDTQLPLIALGEMLGCIPQQPFAIPFIIWDLSQIYLVAAAPTNVRVLPFRSQFV